MLTESIVLELPGDTLVVSVKKYTPSVAPVQKVDGQKPITLLLGHAAGFHKEHWEPVLSYLFKLQTQNPNLVPIKEAFAIDCPDHGESAVLNEEQLHLKPRFISCYDYGNTFVALMNSKHFDSKNSRIVAIGHSAGSVSLILSTHHYYHPTQIPFERLILVEPSMITRRLMASDEAKKVIDHVIAGSRSRRDTWKDTDDVLKWFGNRSPWKYWDPRIMSIYLEHGFRPLPTRDYPDVKEGVTLKCAKSVQGNAHQNIKDQYHALDRLNQICEALPVHAIFGSRMDYFNKGVQKGICDEVEGRKMASVSYLPGVGHMAVQEAPDALATEIFHIITGQKVIVNVPSKL